MVTLTGKREAVAHLKTSHEMSERRARRVIMPTDDGALSLPASG
jgi:hypothetical protein